MAARRASALSKPPKEGQDVMTDETPPTSEDRLEGEQPTPKQFLTIAETAEMLCVSSTVVYRFIRDGELRAVNFGRGQSRSCLRIRAEWIEEFISSREVTPPKKRRRSFKKPKDGVINFSKDW